MVPHVARRGRSFRGAGLYFLHDKKAKTLERVEWTYTHNLHTDDPEKALRMMAYTSMNAEQLKRQAGLKSTGRKSKTGDVYHYSLSWHPDERPNKKHMIESALETLTILKLTDHEAVFLAHNDEPHSHAHCIVNLIHPETGKKANPYKDHLNLSKWALEYEKKHGQIYCEQRLINNELRKQKENKNRIIKHQKKSQDDLLYDAKLKALLDRFEKSVIEKEKSDKDKEVVELIKFEKRDAKKINDETLRRKAMIDLLDRQKRMHIMEWDREQNSKRRSEERVLKEFYSLDQKQIEIERLESFLEQKSESALFRMSGKKKQTLDNLEALKKQLSHSQQRFDEQMSRFNQKLDIEKARFLEDLNSRSVDDVINDISELENWESNQVKKSSREIDYS